MTEGPPLSARVLLWVVLASSVAALARRHLAGGWPSAPAPSSPASLAGAARAPRGPARPVASGALVELGLSSFVRQLGEVPPPTADRPPLVLIAGSSLLRNALGDLKDLERRVAEASAPAGGLRPMVRGVIAPALDLAAIEPHLDALLDLRPALLVVQADMFAPFAYPFAWFRKARTDDPRWLFGTRVRPPHARRTKRDLSRARRHLAEGVMLEGPCLEAGRSLLDGARARSVPVVLVELPLAGGLLRAAEVTALARRSALLDGLAGRGVTVLRPLARLEDEHFEDYLHMSPSGRDQVVAKLAPALAAALAGRD